VADDAKLQIEFNPAAVRAYRLIGYEGRLLRDEDFADDAKDAGDVGAGHTATALYEVVPAGVEGTVPVRDAGTLRYSAPAPADGGRRAGADELLFVQLRYKVPGEPRSRLVTRVARDDRATAASADLRFASAVAEFGMLLRGSPFKGEANAASVVARASGALGDDPGGYRAEFVRLVERYRALDGVAARE
jgi:Ca-activated chloride channel family protein